jgi:hypothetical protein
MSKRVLCLLGAFAITVGLIGCSSSSSGPATDAKADPKAKMEQPPGPPKPPTPPPDAPKK